MRVLKRVTAFLLPAILLAATAGCGGTAAGNSREVLIRETNGTEKKTTYNVLEIQPTELSRTADLSVSASYQMQKTVSTGSAEYRLKEVCVNRGQKVSAGDPIAILQGLGSTADVELKELELQSARSSMNEMLAYYQSAITAAEALPSGTDTESRVRELRIESAKLQYRNYQLQGNYRINALMKELETLQAAAGEIVLTAPVDGTVRSMPSRYSEGDLVPPRTPICTINAAEGFRMYATSANGNFVYGREVTLSFGSGSRQKTFTGRVVSSPEVSPTAVMTNGIVFEIDADEKALSATEGNAQVSFVLLKDVYAIPKNALTTADGVSYVELLIDGSVRTRTVARGPMAGTNVAILAGLEEGDLVVLSSYNS